MIEQVEATEIIEEFQTEFGQPHLWLAYHAAFPLLLNPDLLYHIWATFQWNLQGRHLDIPWYAVADVLLSPLCSEVSYETYTMAEPIRNALLAAMVSDPQFQQVKRSRLRELGEFLIQYVSKDSNHPRLSIREQAEAQRWNALAYLQPQALATAIKNAYVPLSGTQNKAQHLRLANLLQTFDLPFSTWAKPDIETAKQLQALRDYGLGWKYYYQGQTDVAHFHFSAYKNLIVEDLVLPLPQSVQLTSALTPDRRPHFKGINNVQSVKISEDDWRRTPITVKTMLTNVLQQIENINTKLAQSSTVATDERTSELSDETRLEETIAAEYSSANIDETDNNETKR